MKSSKQMVAEAMELIRTLSIKEAAALHLDSETTFVDIRDPREIERDGTIPNARHAPRGMLEFWMDPESPYHKPLFAADKPIVFFCASGWRSALATRLAQEMGITAVSHIGGGFSAWKQAGHPIQSK